ESGFVVLGRHWDYPTAFGAGQGAPRRMSVYDQEIIVGSRDSCGKTPGRDAGKLFGFGNWPSCAVVKLIRQRAAFLPACPLRPNEERFAILTYSDSRVLAAFSLTCVGDRFTSA